MEWMKDPSVTQYNLPSRTHLPKSVDLNRLKDAFEVIIRQRKELRTRFVIVDGDPRQYTDDEMRIPIPVHHMTDDEAAKYIEGQFVRPFDLLSGDPLFRVEMIEAEKDNWLLVDIHHAIGDGVTLAPNLTIYDIPAAYRGEALEPVEYGMYDYAEDEQQCFGTENYQRAAQYYQEKFAGIDFVSLAGNPDSHLGNMVRESAFMPADEVDEWCKTNGTTSNLLYMAAFSLVMSRLSREQQVAYYSVNHGRMDKRLARAYGMFVKSVPILADVVPGQNVLDFIKGFRRELMSTIRYGVYPFNHFCRDLGVQPKVSFGFQGYAMQEYTDLDGIHCTAVQMPKGKIDDDMSCVIYLSEGRYDIRMESSDALNSSETLRIVADAVKTVTEYMMAHPDVLVEQVPLLSVEAQKDIASQCQGKSVPVVETTFPSLFMQQASATPDAPAVVDEAGTYSYAALNNLSGALAQRLVELGVKQNNFVSIMLGYQKEFLVAAIGVEKAGGAYVPLDYDYPTDRLLYMLEDSESQVLITSHAIFDEKNADSEFAAFSGTCLFVDDFLTDVSGQTADHTDGINLATPDGLAYMIYTSGSTGKPKGVMISHRAKSNFVQFIAREWGHTSKSRICCHSSFSFDASIEDLYPVLTVGGTLYTVPQEARKDLAKLHDFIVKNCISGGCYTTQLGQMLLQEYPDLPVEYLVVGGEKMTVNPDCKCRLINTYGPTEFTVDATFYELKKGKEYRNIPIGRPLDNLSAYVVDAAGHLLPQGMPGELCMSGPQMASGYWKREDLTAEKFSAIKVGDEQVKVYHTGDLVRYNAEGQIEYLGRIDNQIKLRGFRIELGEIETLIGKYEGIQMESVQVREVGGVQYLCAYYTADREIDQEALRSFLAEELTDYMVPTAYMQLDEMPLTPNGKVNTKALPAPDINDATEYVEPATEIEKKVAEAMQQVLGLSQPLGALANFMEMGGDSIKAIRLVSKLRQEGVNVNVADVLKLKTIRQIAGTHVDSQINISQEPWSGTVTDSPMVVYFKDLHLPVSNHYLQSIMMECKEHVDIKMLQSALNAITTQHDMLRAIFDGEHLVVRPADAVITIEEQDFADSENLVADIEAAAQEVQSNINMAESLLRVVLFHTPAKDYLLMAAHHLVVDGVSWRIITTDLNTAYLQLANQQEIHLAEKTHTYQDYAVEASKYRDSYKLSLEIPYWNAVNEAMLQMPLSAEKDFSRSFGRLTVSLPADATKAFLQTTSNSFGATVNDLLLTAIGRSYQRSTGSDSVSFMLEGHGREEMGSPLVTDRTVGWFTSMFPVVLRQLGADLRHDLRHTKEALHRIPNKGVGYNILRYLGADSLYDRNQSPLILFNYLGDFDDVKDEQAFFYLATDVHAGVDVAPENSCGSDLTINCEVNGGSFNLHLDYNMALLTDEKAKQFADGILTEICEQTTYLAQHTDEEITATDLGEDVWSDEEFETVTKEFAQRGEKLQRIYPLLPMQESMLLKYLSEPESWAYRLVNIFELNVLPTEAQLRNSLDRLAARHEVLRTAIIHDGVSQYRQAIVDRRLGLRMVDISNEPDQKAAVARLREDILTHDFDLQRKPLMSLVCARTSEHSCYLLIVTHHIIEDGWCLMIYMRDLLTYIDAAIKGVEPMDEGEPIVGRYEAAIREILSKDKPASLEYWRHLLEGYETRVEIPSFGDVPESEQATEDDMQIVLDRELTDRLQALCQSEQATMSNIIELAWGLILQTYGRTQDAVFAKVVSGRDNTKTDVDEVVGLFINSVPVRVKTETGSTARQMLRVLQQQATETGLHDYCSLAEIQQQSELGSQLLQSVTAFENYNSGSSFKAQKFGFDFKVVSVKEENFDEFNQNTFIDDEGRLTLHVIFNRKHYRKQEVLRVLKMFQTLMKGMAEQPDAPLSSLPRIDEAETAEVLGMSYGGSLDYDDRETWIDMFQRYVKQQPDHVAVVDATSQLTFLQFDQQANAVAKYLVEQGIQPDDFVAIKMDRVKEFFVAVLGINKAGAAYVPVDPEYPQDRIEYMLEDSEAKIVMTQEMVASLKPVESFDSLATPDSHCYMIYTSGSTGKPKGVVIDHKSVRACAAWNIPAFGLCPGKNNLHHPSFSFDASTFDLFYPLAAGATIHVLNEEMRKDMDGMARYIEDHHITGMTMSTALGMALLRQFDLPIEYTMLGGEKFMQVKKTGAKLFNGYGPTEFTVCSSYHIIDQDKDIDIPIGKAIPNSYSFICDINGNLLPKGVPGELCLSGIQIANCYWHRPDLTAEKFVMHQYGGNQFKVYRTGDLARYNEEGELEFMGRIDNQVKLRGFRIELGEIENRAAQYEPVAAVAAEVKKVGDVQHLVLYYTCTSEVDKNALRDFMGETLTDYMVPDIFMPLDEMPMTPGGKVNRRALPQPVITSSVAYVKPANETEQAIADTIQHILSLTNPVGSLDSFFELGGDSIKAIRLVSELRQQGISTQVADIMKFKTVQAIAHASHGSGQQTISQEPWSGEVADSAIVAFFKDLQIPMPQMFHQSMLLNCKERVDIDMLQQAIDALTVHHDMLRAVFTDGHLFVRPAECTVQIQEYDLTNTTDSEHAMADICKKIIAGIDMAESMFQPVVFHTTSTDILFLATHHLIVDGVSWRILTEDLETAYQQLTTNQPVSLPAKTHSYQDYVAALQQYRNSYLLSLEIPYWEHQQQKLLALPTSDGKDYARSFMHQSLSMTAEETRAFLSAELSAFGIDANDLLLTAVARSYHSLTGATEMSVQLEGHGREKISADLYTDRTVGWFTSTYPLVTEGINGDIRHDLWNVKEQLHQIPNKGIGYNILRFIPGEQTVTLPSDRVAQIGFNYMGDMDGVSADTFFSMAQVGDFGDDSEPKNMFGPDLIVNCEVSNGLFSLTLDYNAAQYKEEDATRFSEGILTQIGTIVHYLSELKERQYTPSDLGITGWTDTQFEQICNRFAVRGEQLQRVYPLSPMQEGMLLTYQMNPDTTAYRLLTRFSMSVLPSEKALRSTLDYLAEKHEVLRTSILYEGVPMPCQAIVDRKLKLEMIDISGEKDTEAAAARVHEEQLHRKLSLQDDSLLRLVCMKTSDSSCQLLLVLHHIIVDGWCIPIYMRDLIEGLAAGMANEQLTATGVEPGLYEAYIRELLTKDMRAALSYWRDLLMGYESKAVIPSTGTIPEEQQDADDVVTFTLTGDDVRQLNETCASQQVTLNTAVELAWGLLLQSYNRTEDAVFVKVVSGRNNTQVPVDQLVGLFINSVPVRIRTNSQMTVREALRSVQAQAAESSAWDFCPLSDIQQQTDLGSELFQSIVAFENYAGVETLTGGPEEWGIQMVPAAEASFNEISIVAEGGQDGNDLDVKVTFDRRIYHRFEIQRMMSAFKTLLIGIGNQPDAAVQSLQLVDENAKAELMSISSGDTMLLPEGCTFVTEFVRQASETPDSIAVVDKDSSITYAELDRQSNIMAHHLQQLGLKPNQFVGIMLDRQKEFHVSVLGIQKSGAGYLPMDYEYPADRLQYMFEDSEADILITTRVILAEKQAEGTFTPKHTVFIEEFDFSQGDETPVNLTTPENRAYMIYTSGSTGKPKGVIIQQKAKINFVKFLARHLDEQPGEHICCYASFSFDASVKDLYPPLTVGATLYLVPTAIRKDMNELTQWLRDNKINGGNYTTKIGELLMTNYELPVRYVMVGGEKLESFPLLNRGKLRLLNSYGPTETTVDVTTHWVDPTKEYDIPIGRPVVNTTAYIIDAQGRLTPRGVPGELCIGGVQLAEGYYNRPELTAKMFEQCPFEKEGNRMYHTGDLCRWNEDGEIEYVGRIDNQVKLRGYRIELGEIESQIAKYDGVMLACVLVKELNGVQNLCAYFTANHQVDIDDLKAHLGESLTEYMVPTIYIQMDEMPMTQNGKINRRALPQPTIEAEEIVAPSTPEEQQLWDFVTKMLKTTDIGVTTNLVSVGLSSIAAMRLSAQLMSNGLKLSARDILSHPSIRELAGLITEATPEQQLKPHEVREFYPMNESQRGMFVDWMMNPDALQYNIPSMFKFKDIDIEQLKRAIHAVADAHPYLKCRLTQQGDDVVQVRNDEEPVHFEVETLTEQPDAEFFKKRIRPFDLLHEPLYRFNIYIYGDTTYLLIDIHHIIGDGSSNYVLSHELERAYRGEILEKETYTAYDRAIDEIALMESERGQKAEEFFDNLVGGVDATVYPHSNVTPSKVVYGELFTDIEAENIDAYCKKHSIPPSSFFLTVFHHVLHRVTRDDNTLVYFISNGRSELALNNFFGVLVKTLPTVVSNYHETMHQAAANLHKQMQEAISNDFYPFTKMVERHGLKAEILYNYFVDLQTDISLGEHTDDGMAIEWDTAKTPLSITMIRGDRGQYQSMLEYDATLYTKEDMEILNKAFKTFAELCVLPDYEDVTCVPMVDNTEAGSISKQCQGKSVPVVETTFPSLFMQQASATPDAPAVVDEAGTYSYAALNNLSGALAQRLVELGVKQNNFVSIMLGYQKEFLVAAIGVEKAGGAYVPLDYDYPTDRLLYMLEDSESQVLITSHAIFDEKNADSEFAAFSGTCLFVDDFLTDVSGQTADHTDGINLATPDGLAYMIYTSGSTGKPKGVMISHRAKSNFVQFIAREWGHTSKSRICCHSSFSFDASIEDLYPVLTVGGTLYTVPQEARKDLAKLHDFIVKNCISGGCYTTQLGQMLLQEYPDLPVEYLVVGGEKMTVNPDCKCRLINTYGPTEFTVDATFYELKKGKEYRNIPIGRPLDNLSAYVVDAAGHLLPQGMPGELCMSGPQMASGYWKREDLTAEKFSAIKVGDEQVKVYHTGDLVRYNAEGQIEYLGRIDNQIKLRGFRIELGEIETLIGKYEGIQMESVQVREVGGVQYLCAYYTADREIDQEALRSFLAEELTDYMVPTAYMQLDEMPLTPNGKVNTKALPNPDVQSDELVAPVTPSEKALFKLAAEMLKHEQFGITSNLIAMGLTSLSAMRFTVAAFNQFGVQLSVKEVMQHPTIHQLAAMIDSKKMPAGTQEVQEVNNIWPYGKQYYYPITENQRGVFLDWELNRDTTQYNVPEVHLLKDGDAEKLRQALEKVVNAHPYLKTHFVQHEGDVMQIRRDEEPVEILMEALTEAPDEAFFQSRVRPFDLYNDTLYRMEIYTFESKVYFFMDIHHSIYDGASSLFLLNDIFAAYQGEEVQTEEYTAFDFALDELKLLKSEKYSEAEEYFKKLIGDHETVVYPHSKTLDTDGESRINTTINGQDITEFCHQQGLTPNNYFLTILTHVLHAITREDDIAITTINNGRSDVKMMGVMGMFVKTLPVVSTASDALQPFANVAKKMQDQVLETQSRDFYPFTKMAELYGLRPEIMYVYQPSEGGEDETDTQIRLTLNQTKLPLTISVVPENANFILDLEYDNHLYCKADMVKLADVLKNVAEHAFCAEKLADVKLLSDEEQNAMIDFCKGKELDVDITKTFIEKFVEIANRQPDALAVTDVNSQFTYGELNKKSDTLAHYLIENGVTPDDFVCVMLERRKEFILCVHAIHKAAAAYAPLDIDYPADRLQYMIEDCQAKVLLTTHAVLEAKQQNENLSFDESRTRIIFIEDLDLNIDSEPICLAKPENLAYMIYTSGSTGKPKGTMLHQAGLMNCVEVVTDEQTITANDRVGVFYAFSFDAHVVSIYPVLFRGGSLHIMPSSIRKDLELTVEFLRDNQITACGFPTAIGSLIVMNYPELPLRLISMGGERMDGLYSDKYTIVNAYGPTECTCEVTYFTLESGKKYDNIPIGRPTANNWGFVTDKYGRLLPQGIAGEFCFAGIQIGRGYWNLPEKTAEVFGDCPFVSEDRWGRKVRMYHTGDMVCYRADGELEFIGRIDNQVKLRGFRIELGEIENRAMLFDGIKQTAVLVKKINGAEHLCLYYTTTKDVDEKALKEFLAECLAEYMVPDAYMLMDTMPMTPNGKINRKSLPLPTLKAVEIVAAANETEQELLDIVFELLGNDQFGVTTNLISMGLTSLLAMRFSSLAKQKLGLHVPTKEILVHPTVRELAALANVGDNESVLNDILAEKRDYYPLTENQRGVYIDWELNRETTQYNIPLVKEYARANAEKLRDALVATIEAHAYMKTRMSLKNGDVVQLRRDDAPIHIKMETLDYEPDEQFFQSRICPFNLFEDDLYRLEIYQTPTTTWLFMDMHHIIFDGGSNLVFLTDVERVLNGESLEKEQFSAFDYSLYEQNMASSSQYQKAEGYFDELLQGPELAVYPRSMKDTTAGNQELKISLARKDIAEWCRQNGVTESNFMLTVLLQVLHRTTREEQLYITTIDNGRSEMNLLDCVGMFVKTLPVTSNWDWTRSEVNMATAVHNTQNQFFDTKANSFYPFTKMVERHNIRPEIMYVYQGGLDNPMPASSEQGETPSKDKVISLTLDTAKLPLTVTVWPADDDHYTLLLEYDGTLYNQKDMERLASMLSTFAVRSINATDLNTISMVDEATTEEVLRLSEGKTLPVDLTMTFAHMFTEQAHRTPDAPAVVDKSSQLTYAEMDTYSNLLASKLIALGIEPDDFVCVLLDRMKEFPLSVLAIHKAGAAYTPLDFEYPNDRLLYMMENSEAKVIVTTHDVLKAKKEEGDFEVGNAQLFFIDDFMNELSGKTLAELGEVKPIDLSSPDRLAYMIYTSGSTGKPKGAMLHQAGLANFIAVVKDMEKLTPADRISGHRSFSFDAHIEDMYPVLTLGGSFHIMPSEIRKDLGAIRQFLFDHQITGGGYSTAITCLLLNTFDDLPVRFITGGGEKMAGVYSDHIEIINVYGPTECTDDTSYFSIAPGKHIEEIPIGKSVANNWNFIVDQAGHLLPPGLAGELCFAGVQVGRGYWRLPERTEQSFVNCPFVKKDQWKRKVRMYHTGDLCRWNEDGELEYISRIDTQVKLRGFRIELGEIEKCAMNFGGMVTVVADVKTINGTQHLCMYFTADQEIDIEQLRELMSQTLTDYMVPEAFVKMDAMPMTPNGKIDRKKLPVPEIKVATECVPPATKREEKLFEIAKELLGHDQFGVTDNLMRVGMTSLLVIRLVAKACYEGIKIKVDDFMRAKTIRGVLATNQRLMTWYQEPVAEKPVAVVIQGETRYNNLLPYIKELNERYNVVVVEAITTHFDYLFHDYDIHEAIEFYFAWLDALLMKAGLDSVSLFTGHCFGSDLAYRLACRWQQEYPEQPVSVCMLDSFWVDRDRKLERPQFDLSSLPASILEKIDEMNDEQESLLDMYKRLDCHGEPEPLKGNVLLISAAQKENMVAQIAEKLGMKEDELVDFLKVDADTLRRFLIPQRELDNVALWSGFRSDLRSWKVYGDHMTMLNEQNVKTFMQFIFDNI